MRTTLLTAAAITLAAAPTASAQDATATETARIADGQTMLRLDRGVSRALAGAGVEVSLVRPGTLGRSGLTFPVTGGRADPRTAAGTIRHRGGIRFRARGRTVTLRTFVVRVGDRSTLSAVVGGTRVPILSLSTRRAVVRPGGPTTRVSRVTASLTGVAARALNRAFGTSLFRGGLRLGTVRSELEFGEIVLGGGSTTLALDPGAAQALDSLGIVPSPIDPASAGGQGIAFPITGGTVDARSLAGTIGHSGGLALTRGDTRVELREFTIGIDDTPALSALVGDERVEIVTLDASNATARVRGRDVTLGNVVARLTAGAAQALNQAFGTDAFTEGLTLGTATVHGRTL